MIFTDIDVYGGSNATETDADDITEKTEFQERPPTTTSRTERTTKTTQPKPKPTNNDCNASTTNLKVTPQEVHHHHHHYFPNVSGSNPFGIGYGGGGDNCKMVEEKVRELTAVLENMKFRLSSLTEVVEDLIQQSNIGTKLLLTGAKIEAGTNLFELLRYVLLERLELKDLKNDIYSATRTKDGVVFDVASALDKKRILTRSRERLTDDEDIRIVDYYLDPEIDQEGKPKPDIASMIDSRFGADD